MSPLAVFVYYEPGSDFRSTVPACLSVIDVREIDMISVKDERYMVNGTTVNHGTILFKNGRDLPAVAQADQWQNVQHVWELHKAA